MKMCSGKKKWIIAMGLLLVGIICGIIGFYGLQPQLVTGKRAELQQVIIVERYPGEGGGSEGEPKLITTITDKRTMDDIYDELRQIRPKKETTGERFYTMVSPLYELKIYYTDNLDEVNIYTAGAVRYLGRPDWFTVSNKESAERVITFLDSIVVKNTLPEGKSTEESTETEEIIVEAPVVAKGLSIVFMGETITAPGEYPGVPDLYIPILDDLYIYGILLNRSETLNYEGKITGEIMNECEDIQRTIRQRGYISYPYGGIEGTSGYALVDFDGDDIPELLLLNNSPRILPGEQTPAISTVFAIRNGCAVQIELVSNSYVWGYYNVVLAADGTFYHASYYENGYARLGSFRLESGMSEFTPTSEARASLSFPDGDVPVPYWVKIENGEDVNITEEEFDVMYNQHSYPKERMILDFVPLHSDLVDPWSIPRLTDDPPSIQIEYPIAYKGSPEEYKPILDALLLLGERLRLGEYGYGYDLEAVGFGECPYPSDSTLGYALVDLNNDETPELLLGYLYSTEDGQEEFQLCSVFTLKAGKPVLLKSFWSRSRGAISADGTIYC